MSINHLIYLVPILVIIVMLILRQQSFATEEQVRTAMQNAAKVIDVRTPQEYASGHLPNAVNIPVDELQARIGQFVPKKEQPLLLHCASGMRSGQGKAILEKLGYTQVFNVGSYSRAAKLL